MYSVHRGIQKVATPAIFSTINGVRANDYIDENGFSIEDAWMGS